MLNISKRDSINEYVHEKDYSAFQYIGAQNQARKILLWLVGLLIVVIIFAFLPWQQNVISKGFVTSLRPEQRPQTVQSLIAGRIDRWYVQEGDFVEAGDTIVKITDAKGEYFDPELLQRTREQLEAKKGAVTSYQLKVDALDQQIEALKQTRDLKLNQARNYLNNARLKVVSDSMAVEAAKIDYDVAVRQFERTKTLYEQDLESLTKLENRRTKMQSADAKLTEARNKLESSRNDLVNANIELNSLQNQYADKLSKAYSEKAGVFSQKFDSEGSVSKLTNQLSTYSVRAGYYVVRAPQSGFITEALTVGIGEIIKEGEQLVSIMPANFDLAVEMYVDPIDIPLFSVGNKVRFTFDGWPAVVFSGWPDLSFGTFEGKVFAIDRFTNGSGKFRVLVSENEDYRPWPEGLRLGTGAQSFALLNTVPVWYEIWRRLNGFPPDYYDKQEQEKGMDKETVKTLKRLK